MRKRIVVVVLGLVVVWFLIRLGVNTYYRYDSEILIETTTEATVIILGKKGEQAYFDKDHKGAQEGVAYLVEFVNGVTNTLVFPKGSEFIPQAKIRVSYARSPFHNGIFASTINNPKTPLE